ncbi:VanZ family protein [Agromyces archimandritae]|uniref:VanZ family protein n=1 Tax=Agromyces archimandritae TaxID=2781962 RepID=A0A975IQU7_9MICO|nr:VanZ family protein [Agromyces archimandritae]QTX05421.1 VanZ family protein [Agromyces archimandritae]
MTEGATRFGRGVARVLLPPYLLALMWVVCSPADQARHVTGFVGLLADGIAALGFDAAAAFAVIEFAANIVMFVPFGLLLPLATPVGPGTAVIAAAGTSVVIELVQLVVPGRVSTGWDVLANTAGAAVGAGIAALAMRAQVTGRNRESAPQEVRG